MVKTRIVRITKICLQVLLIIISIVTLLNILAIDWITMILPISSFSAMQLLVISVFEGHLILVPVTFLIVVLLLLSAISIRRNKIILPLLALLYHIYDLVAIGNTALIRWNYGVEYFFVSFFFHILTSSTVLALLFVYCWRWMFLFKKARKWVKNLGAKADENT